MARYLHAAVTFHLALALSVTTFGCGKTDKSSHSRSAVGTTTTPQHAKTYVINMQSNGEEIAVIELLINDDTAISKVTGVTEQFDIKNQRWQHDESKQWVTLSQCKSWANQSKEKTMKSNASAPEQIRTFVEWSLDPKFEIESTENMLTLTSGQVDYKITVEKHDGYFTNYYRFARLNAYKKAMTEGRVPPFAELLVIEELERRGLMPKVMEVQIPGIQGAPSIKILVSTQVEAAENKEE